MSNRYLAWTLLIAACGLQSYLVATGIVFYNELQLFLLPRLLPKGPAGEIYLKYLLSTPVLLLNFVLPPVLTYLSLVFFILRKKFGWILALAVDLYFGIPMLILCSFSFIWNLQHPHTGLQHSDDPSRLVTLASLHILLLSSPPVRALLFPSPQGDFPLDISLHIASAR